MWGSKRKRLAAEMMELNPRLTADEVNRLTTRNLKGRLFMMKQSAFDTKIQTLIAQAKEEGVWAEEPGQWKITFV